MNDTNILTSPTITPEQQGQRIDRFLASIFTDLSRSQIQRLISEGNLSSDDNIIADNSFKIRSGDTYQLEIPEAEEAIPEPENIPLDITYEDNDLIVINKPAGMTVHPAAGAHHGTLVNALLYHCQGNLSGIGGIKRPGIVHRIDKDTSGLLVVAKNDITHRHLCEQFAEHTIERTYFAIVYSTPSPINGQIVANIGRSPYDRKKMAILTHGGKHAVTNYKTIERFSGVSLVQCNLETGRTHQIRVHMSSIGCNLVGDQVYEKNKKSNIRFSSPEIKQKILSFPRQALHATTLGFIHPKSKEKMSFFSEFTADFADLLNSLRHHE